MAEKNKIKVSRIDDRLKGISALGLFAALVQLLRTNADLVFPNIADTLTQSIDFYLPLTVLFLVVLLYKTRYTGKHLPPMPKAYKLIRNYAIWFTVFWVATFLLFFLAGFGIIGFGFPEMATRYTGIGSFILNFVIAAMENLALVMVAPALFAFNLGGSGLFSKIIEYIPAGIVATLSHMSVYWTQVQIQIQKTGEDPLTAFAISLGFAYIAFTVFYLVYRYWGFAASVALHQAFNMNNSWLGG